MFWFPARDDGLNDRNVFEELSPSPLINDTSGKDRMLNFLENQVSTLIQFLVSMEEVYLYDGRKLLGQVRCKKESQDVHASEISVIVNTIRDKTEKFYFRQHTSIAIPSHITGQPETPKALKSLKEANLTLSVLLEQGQPIQDSEAHFHVYFPTAETDRSWFCGPRRLLCPA